MGKENEEMYKVFYCDNCHIITINVLKFEEKITHTSFRYNNNSLEETYNTETNTRNKIICGSCKNSSSYRNTDREILVGKKLYGKVLKSNIKVELNETVCSVSDSEFLNLKLIDNEIEGE